MSVSKQILSDLLELPLFNKIVNFLDSCRIHLCLMTRAYCVESKEQKERNGDGAR